MIFLGILPEELGFKICSKIWMDLEVEDFGQIGQDNRIDRDRLCHCHHRCLLIQWEVLDLFSKALDRHLNSHHHSTGSDPTQPPTTTPT